MQKTTIGIDIGSKTVSVSVTKDNKVESKIIGHHGDINKVVYEELKIFEGKPVLIAVTGSAGARKIADDLNFKYVDLAVALIAESRKYSKIRHIVDIGAGSLSVVDLDSEGRFSGFRANSKCAAGTGSFLDEQALRMKIFYDQLKHDSEVDNPPRIAARCAVFAKSDLIHRQQEGYSTLEMWSGLCRGMVSTALNTLFRGRKPEGDVLLTGGVAKNKEVVRWLKKELNVNLVVPENPDSFASNGALYLAKESIIDLKNIKSGAEKDSNVPLRDKLELKLSTYPSFYCGNFFMCEDTEVRIHGKVEGKLTIGLDIGSTSTKAVVLNENGEVVADLYRRTLGVPIRASQKILNAIKFSAGENNFEIVGIGTTGSGRKMIGSIIGADLVINEITAHAKGAIVSDPTIETIFEIGGQDAKYIALRQGVPYDSNMNYVCAAGTGSFVEEQANKLGFKLTEIGDTVLGVKPPFSSDRCTVFMEQDVNHLLQKGFSRHEVMGSVLYSVVQNYLERVVGRRNYSKRKICFMGATARNKALVAAFERLINCPIVVSPFCHVMGAFGVAKTVYEDIVKEKIPTKFKGMVVANSEIQLLREECKLCANTCEITKAVIEGVEDKKSFPSWGYMCGREPDVMEFKKSTGLEAFKEREKRWISFGINKSIPKKSIKVGIPRALVMHSYLPMWRRFFSELNMQVVLSKPTHDDTLDCAADFVGADYCYPVKVAHGHIKELLDKEEVNFIFYPHYVRGEVHDDGFLRSVFCPYNIAFPSIARTAGLETDKKNIISPVVNLQFDNLNVAKALYKELKKVIDVSLNQIENAYTKALEENVSFVQKNEEDGKKWLSHLEENNEQGIVILGRPYNVCDTSANLNLPSKFADNGFRVFTVDMLPLKDVKIDPVYHNMYWRYGRKILQAATFVKNHQNLHAVFISNFGCGPDSFLQTYVEKIMENKPLLLLELDEHSADAGYITRIEAFKDVISKSKKNEKENVNLVSRSFKFPKTIWLPPLHPYGSTTLAASMRSLGIPARPLPSETYEAFAEGKKYCRGTECVPAPSTIGAFIKKLKESKNPEEEALFMPSACGPCRFGQYHTLHRMILDMAGYKNTNVEAWSDKTGTYGLSAKGTLRCFSGIVAGDLLFKARCRLRPYVKDRVLFDKLMEKSLKRTEDVLEKGGDVVKEFKSIAKELGALERVDQPKPIVGIVGEIYVRANTFLNCKLVETIEESGGEAWLAPISEWFHYLTFLDLEGVKENKMTMKRKVLFKIKSLVMQRVEDRLFNALKDIISDRKEPSIKSTVNAGERVFPRQFDGESIMTVGRAIEFAENGASLIVNCAPFGCMPGTLTAGIFQKLEGELNVPVASLFFDGEADMTHMVRTYMANIIASKS